MASRARWTLLKRRKPRVWPHRWQLGSPEVPALRPMLSVIRAFSLLLLLRTPEPLCVRKPGRGRRAWRGLMVPSFLKRENLNQDSVPPN